MSAAGWAQLSGSPFANLSGQSGSARGLEAHGRQRSGNTVAVAVGFALVATGGEMSIQSLRHESLSAGEGGETPTLEMPWPGWHSQDITLFAV
jgi:hypothetical protein